MSKLKRAGALNAVALAMLLASEPACHQAQTANANGMAPSERQPSVAGTPPQPLEAPTYPPGRWRLVPTEVLERSLLWVSHVLIRHEGTPRTAAFSRMPLAWTPSPDAPRRSRDDARELAERVAARARGAPASFAQLARQYSEDVTTRETGGSLGGIQAASLIHWPAVLDALAALRPGTTSRPVETEFGFHILLLREPPAQERRASGRRIVIGHDDAPWLPTFLARGVAPRRSREAAESLAWDVFRRARARPQDFSRLIDRYSEHQDVLRDGDFGSWSNLERAPFPREVEHLHALAEGEVAEPLDSIYGFQIIQRTPERQRERYAMRLIQIALDPLSNEQGNADVDGAWSNLQAIGAILTREPWRFPEFQTALCCADYVEQWVEGRESALAERAVSHLRVGQIAAEPANLGAKRLAIVERVEPSPEPPLELMYSLPAPERPDALAFLAQTARREPLDVARATLERELKLTPETQRQLAAFYDVDRYTWEAASAEWRIGHLHELHVKLTELLGPDASSRHQDVLERELEQQLLRSGPALWP